MRACQLPLFCLVVPAAASERAAGYELDDSERERPKVLDCLLVGPCGGISAHSATAWLHAGRGPQVAAGSRATTVERSRARIGRFATSMATVRQGAALDAEMEPMVVEGTVVEAAGVETTWREVEHCLEM